MANKYSQHKEMAAICAIQMWALRYIDEWVDYNLALGFDKIFIYDNSNEFELEEWYKHRDNKTKIVIKHYPGKYRQTNAYTECGQHIKRKGVYSWIAFIDLDEFIVIQNTTKHPTILDLLDTVPEKAGGLAINWKVISSSNKTNYEAKPLTLRFQLTKKTGNSHIKTIARAKHFLKAVNPHYVLYNGSVMSVDSSGNQVSGLFNKKQTSDAVFINHYWQKSLEEFKERCTRGSAATKRATGAPCLKEKEWGFKSEARFIGNSTFDDKAWKFLKERVPKYAAKFEPRK